MIILKIPENELLECAGYEVLEIAGSKPYRKYRIALAQGGGELPDSWSVFATSEEKLPSKILNYMTDSIDEGGNKTPFNLSALQVFAGKSWTL